MDIKELKRLIELFNNGGDLSDYAKAKLLTFIDEQQALQLLQTDVSKSVCNYCLEFVDKLPDKFGCKDCIEKYK